MLCKIRNQLFFALCTIFTHANANDTSNLPQLALKWENSQIQSIALDGQYFEWPSAAINGRIHEDRRTILFYFSNNESHYSCLKITQELGVIGQYRMDTVFQVNGQKISGSFRCLEYDDSEKNYYALYAKTERGNDFIVNELKQKRYITVTLFDDDYVISALGFTKEWDSGLSDVL